MPILYLVRHGHIESRSAEASDPGLSLEGQAQAKAVAQKLSTLLQASIPILTSPLRRCRETAAPLSLLWGQEAIVEPRLAELPGPDPAVMAREAWLESALASDWPALMQLAKTLQDGYAAQLTNWLEGVYEAALACQRDTVIFSHFVPINSLVGRATESARVAAFYPDFTSVTVLERTGTGIRLIERGRDMRTQVA